MVDGVNGTSGFNARAVANELFAKGKSGGGISASAWNEYAKAHGGKTIKHSISLADAIKSINTYHAREQETEAIMASLKFEAPEVKGFSLGEEEEQIDLEALNANKGADGAFTVEGNDEVGGAVLRVKNEISAPQARQEQEAPSPAKHNNQCRQFETYLKDLASANTDPTIKAQLLRGKMDSLLNAGVSQDEINQIISKAGLSDEVTAGISNFKHDSGALKAQYGFSRETKTDMGLDLDAIDLEALRASNGDVGAFTVEGNDEVGGAVLKAKEEIAAPPPRRYESPEPPKLKS